MKRIFLLCFTLSVVALVALTPHIQAGIEIIYDGDAMSETADESLAIVDEALVSDNEETLLHFDSSLDADVVDEEEDELENISEQKTIPPTNRIIVQYKEGIGVETKQTYLSEDSLNPVKTGITSKTDELNILYQAIFMQPVANHLTGDFVDSMYIIEFDKTIVNTHEKLEEISRRFQIEDSNVIFAEPDLIVKIEALPNDIFVDPNQSVNWTTSICQNQPNRCTNGVWEDMWGLKRIGMEAAWGIEKGQTRPVVVAVIDSGLDYNHPDIDKNVYINPKEDLNNNGVVDGVNTCPIPNGDFNCKDDDNNGYIDDIRGYDFTTCAGWNLLGQCFMGPKIPDNDPMDENDHGSHVSGTISTETNNKTGIAGMSWHAKIMPIKAFNPLGYLSDAIKSLVYARDNGAEIINNSWGGAGHSQALTQVINSIHKKGIIVVSLAP